MNSLPVEGCPTAFVGASVMEVCVALFHVELRIRWACGVENRQGRQGHLLPGTLQGEKGPAPHLLWETSLFTLESNPCLKEPPQRWLF